MSSGEDGRSARLRTWRLGAIKQRNRALRDYCVTKGAINTWMRMIVAGFFGMSFAAGANAQVPDAIAAAPDEARMLTIHAQGAQIYECKADSAGKLVWQFREPIAALIVEGKTVGRHYAGPNWELTDGSAVTAKVGGRAPGATAKDIPLLRLEVTSQRGRGQLTGASTIQRLNTKGGAAEGPCESSGTFLNVPYSADYAFFRKGG